MSSSPASQNMTRTTAAVMTYLLALAGAAAAITRVAFAAPARRLLAVHFTHVAHRAGAAAAIWAHNATIAMGFAVFLGCAYLIQREERPARIERTILRAADAALVLWGSGTAVLAGVLAGAYGLTQIRAFLPQGPVELAAWTLLIALYTQVRSRRIAAARAAFEFAVVLLLLAAAAILELWMGA